MELPDDERLSSWGETAVARWRWPWPLSPRAGWRRAAIALSVGRCAHLSEKLARWVPPSASVTTSS